jgi:glycosyltransferase involved in cell wall biosynthesis
VRVLAATQDVGGCRFYRISEPGRVLVDQFDVDFRIDGWVNVDATQRPDGTVQVHEVQEDVDLIVIQRPLDAKLFGLIKQAQRQGIAIVVEIDDNFRAVHPRNLAYRKTRPSNNPLYNYEWLERSAGIADLVTVSTQALADHYAPHGRYTVLKNAVPEQVFEIEKTSHTPPRVGWSGTIQTHPGDLESAGGGVARAIHDHDASVIVVGDSHGVAPALSLPLGFEVAQTGWVPLDEYYQTIADNIDIGIVPLEDSTFNRSKSWLKGLEFAALGIPSVASPLPEYRSLAAHGVVELASSPGDWRKKLGDLLRNGKRRTSQSQRIREIVHNNFTYESTAQGWYDAYSTAIENRKADQ